MADDGHDDARERERSEDLPMRDAAAADGGAPHEDFKVFVGGLR